LIISANRPNFCVMGTITCNRCRKTLDADQFALKRSSATIRRNRCRRCCEPADRWQRLNAEKARQAMLDYRSRGGSRSHHLRKVRGIDPAEYDRMLAAQSGVCAICASDKPGGRWSYFNVDHCHATGRVRGLLCSPCNRALGFFCDDPIRLARAIEYVSR
jgi:hypothetical protein